MKKLVKLSTIQLRTIINEELKSAKKKRLVEYIDKRVEDIIDNLESTLTKDLLNVYDEHDPVMSHHGQEKWAQQVHSAVSDVIESINTTIREKESDLIDGAYFDHAEKR